MKTIKELTAHLSKDANLDQILEACKDIPPIQLKLCPYCQNTPKYCNCI